MLTERPSHYDVLAIPHPEDEWANDSARQRVSHASWLAPMSPRPSTSPMPNKKSPRSALSPPMSMSMSSPRRSRIQTVPSHELPLHMLPSTRAD